MRRGQAQPTTGTEQSAADRDRPCSVPAPGPATHEEPHAQEAKAQEEAAAPPARQGAQAAEGDQAGAQDVQAGRPLGWVRKGEQIELRRMLSRGDVFTHQGVTYRVTYVNVGKGRMSIEPVRGKVRTHAGGRVCVEQEVER